MLSRPTRDTSDSIDAASDKSMPKNRLMATCRRHTSSSSSSQFQTITVRGRRMVPTKERPIASAVAACCASSDFPEPPAPAISHRLCRSIH